MFDPPSDDLPAEVSPTGEPTPNDSPRDDNADHYGEDEPANRFGDGEAYDEKPFDEEKPFESFDDPADEHKSRRRWLSPRPVELGDVVPTAAFIEVRDAVLKALAAETSLLAVTGNAGAGKTTLCRMLAAQARDWTWVHLAARPAGTRRGLLLAILEQVEPGNEVRQPLSEADIRLRLLAAAERCGQARCPLVVVLDDVQRYSPRLLDEARSLTNYLDGSQPLFRVVLVGSRQFERHLLQREFEPVADRLGEELTLRGLSDEEAADYLAVQIARGHTVDDMRFDEEAVLTLAEAAPITPGTLERIARAAAGSVHEACRHVVTTDDILEAFDRCDRRDQSAEIDHAATSTFAREPQLGTSEAELPSMADSSPREQTIADEQAAPSGDFATPDELETVSQTPMRFEPLGGAVYEVGGESDDRVPSRVDDESSQTDVENASEAESATTIEAESVTNASQPTKTPPMETPPRVMQSVQPLPATSSGEFAAPLVFETPPELPTAVGPLRSEGDLSVADVVDTYADPVSDPAPTDVDSDHVGEATTPANPLGLLEQTLQVVQSGSAEDLDQLESLLASRDASLPPECDPQDAAGEDVDDDIEHPAAPSHEVDSDAHEVDGDAHEVDSDEPDRAVADADWSENAVALLDSVATSNEVEPADASESAVDDPSFELDLIAPATQFGTMPVASSTELRGDEVEPATATATLVEPHATEASTPQAVGVAKATETASVVAEPAGSDATDGAPVAESESHAMAADAVAFEPRRLRTLFTRLRRGRP